MTKVAFGGVQIRLPRGWCDITERGGPFTFARAHGGGALQFSIALYAKGKAPSVTSDALKEMVEEKARRFATEGLLEETVGPGLVAAVSFRMGEAFVRLWYLSDGSNVAFVTYTCELGRQGDEVPEAEEVVKTLEFIPGSSRRHPAHRGRRS